MARHVFIVFGSALAGHEEEFNAWYDSQHLPDVMKIPGFVAGQRFRVVQRRPEEATRDYRYMALYEIEADDVSVPMAELRKRVGEGIIDTGTLHQPDMLGFYTATADSVRLTAGRK